MLIDKFCDHVRGLGFVLAFLCVALAAAIQQIDRSLNRMESTNVSSLKEAGRKDPHR